MCNLQKHLIRAALGEDKTWTTFVDRVHGPPVMDQVHGHFFLNNEK